ncbi:hypothetical protein PZN02_005363 [Sinorhizobium garamanticum]|uniref:Tetratricopeptide repeat protein n=1 Tax=Sinorhizobium garamanticum TaxID=680247 RepID=A0ABY8DGK2_9HYPH|nr:hypothetical protein [Sinorhizobium garamanticum]WEX90021.1 hypothetical protein PZN02_005363 [Sinorhizobium garamanticum]
MPPTTTSKCAPVSTLENLRKLRWHRERYFPVAAQPDFLAYLGEFDRAKEWISRALIVTDPDDILDRYNLACAAARMGESDQALNLLESCVSDMPPELVDWMKSDSDLAPLHRDPRFQALVEIEAKPEDAMANQAIKEV